jgi:hypothetical protein
MKAWFNKLPKYCPHCGILIRSRKSSKLKNCEVLFSSTCDCGFTYQNAPKNIYIIPDVEQNRENNSFIKSMLKSLVSWLGDPVIYFWPNQNMGETGDTSNQDKLHQNDAESTDEQEDILFDFMSKSPIEFLHKIGSENDEDTIKYNKIKHKVEEKKTRAKTLGIDQLVFNLFFKVGIKHYPSWMKTEENSKWIPPEMEKAIELKESDKNIKESVLITIFGKNYLLKLMKVESSFNSEYLHHILSLYDSNNKKLLAIECHYDLGERDEYVGYLSDWRLNNVLSFIEGDWISDFRKFDMAVKTMEAKRKKADKKDAIQDYIKESYNNFDID